MRPLVRRRIRRLGRILFSSEDAAARRQAEERLYSQQQRLALITSNAPGLLALLDHELRYLYVNQQFADLILRSPSELIGRHVRDVIGHEAFARAAMHVRRVLKGEQVSYENHLLNAAGKLIQMQVTISPQFTKQGEISTLVVAASDVTAIKQAEQALREANEKLERRVEERTRALEAANQELESFSYSVSHDLRAPLRAINGLSRILLERFMRDLPKEAQDLLHDIRASTEQMARLVDDLLVLARLGRQTIRRQSVDHASQVREILQLLVSAQPERRIETRVGELPPSLADAGLLKQVWQNLLHNALKYTALRDPAIIEVGWEPNPRPPNIGPAVNNSNAQRTPVFYVRDNGVGFDMRYAHKLFNVFQRLHSAEDYEGTGVGLAIVHRIVARHGGQVWAESTPERGATFFFTLPNQNESCQNDP